MSHFLPEERHGVWTAVGTAAKIPPKFTINKILPHGIVFLSGPPKTQKTTVTLAFALTVNGIKHDVLPDELQVCEQEGRAMALNAEHEPGELRQMIEDGFGVEMPDDDGFLAANDPWVWRLDEPGAVKGLIKWLETYDPRLFMIDPLVDFHNIDEKDSRQMVHLLRPLQQWAKKHDSTLLIVHHTRKASGEDPDRNLSATDLRGTSALYGLADGTITLTPKGRAGIHFSVVLKRGEPWEKTLKLGTWGEKSGEKVDATVQAIFDALKTDPNQSLEQLAKLCRCSKSTCSTAIQTLTRLKAIDSERHHTEQGYSIVASALLKWGGSTGLK